MDLDCFFDLGGFESSMNINDHQSSMIIYIYISVIIKKICGV